ncbi:MAG: TolC family protein [Hyphococcus sp.]
MRRRFIPFWLGATMLSPAALAQVELVGSLYPPSTQGPVRLAQESEAASAATPETPPAVSVAAAANPALAKALGPAAYILDDSGVRADFAATVRRAVGRHPAYHAQLSVLDETRAERRRARAALYPQLSTQFRGDYSLTRDFAPGTDNAVEALRPREQFTAGISASQLVYDGGATFQRIKSARARNSEFKNAISTRINDLSLAALAAYHDLATHQALVALGDAFIQRHKKILEDVRERERLGAGSRADVTRAVARLAAAEARVAEIRESKQLADIRYREFFGEDPTLLQRPAFGAFAVDSRAQAISAALERNPEIAVAAARADAATAEYKAAKGARMPELRVSLDAVKFDIFDSGDDFDVRAGVNLNYNIFGGGARAAEIAQAASRARQNRFGEEQIKQEIAREAAIAFERATGADGRLKALETAVIAHDTTRELVLERYRVARGDLIDVLQAENDYFEAGVAFLTGLANRDMALYGLMEHTGDLLRFFSPEQEYANAIAEVSDG